MIKSMTGFGKAITNAGGRKISAEIRSLNSKQFDLNLRIPGNLREKENDIRSLISKKCERGKIDFFISMEEEKTDRVSFFNKKLAKEYYRELKSLAHELKDNSNGLLPIVLKMPEVLKPEKLNFEESEWKKVLACIEKSLKEFNRYREDEGKNLQQELQSRINLILSNLKEISQLDEKRVPFVKEKIRNSISEIKGKIDENRFEQELIFYLEKLDITEEKVRLKIHCDYFNLTMNEENSGRKLNFISQEIGREINTIGSKANDAGIQKLVVQMKDELEKIKEQLNNVL